MRGPGYPEGGEETNVTTSYARHGGGLPCQRRRHGADRRLLIGKEEAMDAAATMLTLTLLLLVIDQMRR
jgi:hypothetical protein